MASTPKLDLKLNKVDFRTKLVGKFDLDINYILKGPKERVGPRQCLKYLSWTNATF